MTEETKPYDIAAIRKLLLAAFTAEDLQRFCQDRPAFQPIVDRFGPHHGKDDMVAEVIDYCETHRLYIKLLAEVQQANPQQYNRLRPYLLSSSTETSPPEPSSHWTVPLLLNLLLVGVAGVILAFVLGPTLELWLPCQSLWTKAFGLPVIVLALIHIVWRLCYPQQRGVARKVQMDLKLVKTEFDIVPWLNKLHLWIFPDWAIYTGALAAIAGALLVIWFVPGEPESMPIVDSYSVRYISSGQTVRLTLAEAVAQDIEIDPGDSVLITVNMLDNANVHCTWDTTQGGKLRPEPDCAARYTAPLSAADDVIRILIKSMCRTRQRWATLSIKVKNQ